MAVRIIIVESHAIIRRAIKCQLETHPQIKVIGETDKKREALMMTQKLNPDIIMINASMPRSVGLETIKGMVKHTVASEPTPAQIRAARNTGKYSQEAFAALLHTTMETVNRWENGKAKPNGKNLLSLLELCRKSKLMKLELPTTKILAYASNDETQFLKQAIENGAHGCILGSSNIKELFEAITALIKGKGYYPTLGSGIKVAPAKLPSDFESNKSYATLGFLTRREREILVMIAEGLSNKQIANKLFLSVKTIETHRTHLMEKLGAHEVTALVRYAIKSGMISI